MDYMEAAGYFDYKKKPVLHTVYNQIFIQKPAMSLKNACCGMQVPAYKYVSEK